MAFTAAEDFDSYTNGEDLASKNGGSGWAAAWSTNQGTGSLLVSTTQFIDSPNSIAWTGAGSNLGPLYNRQFSTALTGTSNYIHVAMWISDPSTTNGGYWEMYVANSALNVYAVVGANTAQGKITLRGRLGATVDLLTGMSANTWYHVYLDLDVTNEQVRGYASTTIPQAVPTWSSYSSGVGTGTIDYIWLSVETKTHSGSSYLDDIRNEGSDFTPVGGASRDARNFTLLGVG